jgi:hypothetical protein
MSRSLGTRELVLKHQPRPPHLFEQLRRNGAKTRPALVCGVIANNINPNTGVKGYLVSDWGTSLALAYIHRPESITTSAHLGRPWGYRVRKHLLYTEKTWLVGAAWVLCTLRGKFIIPIFWKGSRFTRKPGLENFRPKIKDVIHRTYLSALPVIQF